MRESGVCHNKILHLDSCASWDYQLPVHIGALDINFQGSNFEKFPIQGKSAKGDCHSMVVEAKQERRFFEI